MTETLTNERIEEIDIHLAAFSLSMLQDFITFKRHCEKTGIEEAEVVSYLRHEAKKNLEKRRQADEQAVSLSEKSPRCSVCDSQLMLEYINDKPQRMIDDHSNSWWICPDPECPFDPIISDKYPHEILTDIGVIVHRPQPPDQAMRRKKAAAVQRRSGCGSKRR